MGENKSGSDNFDQSWDDTEMQPAIQGERITNIFSLPVRNSSPIIEGGRLPDTNQKFAETMTVKEVRAYLEARQMESPNLLPHQLIEPKFVRIEGGILYPAALMKSGYWERRRQSPMMDPQEIGFRTEFQKWQYRGFSQWAPSWDFTWNLDKLDPIKDKPYVVAQIGDEDEADSLPVYLPASWASRVKEELIESGAKHVTIQGILGHREQFQMKHGEHAPDKYESLLDFCLWLDEEKEGNGDLDHWVRTSQKETEYSGYLWKCVTPKKLWHEKKMLLNLRDVYFIWAHTDFASEQCKQVDLEVLASKERSVQELCERQGLGGDLVVVQKSSAIVKGPKPKMGVDYFYEMLTNKRDLPPAKER